MNNSYLNYLKNFFHIFGNYKKCWNIRKKIDVKKNHNELVPVPVANVEKLEVETNEVIESNDVSMQDVEEQCFQTNSKTSELKTCIKITSSSISLPNYPRETYTVNAAIKEKLKTMPAFDIRAQISAPKLSLKRSYPWQNFNVDDLSTLKYKNVKPVNNLSKEIFETKKLVLKKRIDANKVVKQKKIKGEKSISTDYLTMNYHIQPVKINLSTEQLLHKKSKISSFSNNVTKSDLSSSLPLKKKPKFVSTPYRSRSVVICSECSKNAEEIDETVTDILAEEANSYVKNERQISINKK